MVAKKTKDEGRGTRDERRPLRRNSIVRLGVALVVIILLNIIDAFLFTRFDLTAEKRYSLSPATKKLLKNADDIIFFKVYLEGDLPSGFRRLANETKEMLDEFRAYNKDIQFEFVNPSGNPNTKDRNDEYKLSGCRITSSTVLLNSGNSSRKRTPLWPREISPGCGKVPPPTSATSDIV
jgi:hypothetical protein